MLRFVRINSHRLVLQEASDAQGFDGSHLKRRPASFCEWRWSTMRNVLDYMMPCLVLFGVVWDAALFLGCKAGALEHKARSVAEDATFLRRTKILYDLMVAIHEVRTWGSGCACHEGERMAGQTVVCTETGRRLPEAAGRVSEFLSLCELCAEGPAPWQATGRQILGFSDRQELVFAWQHCRAVAELQTRWVFEQPYTLSTVVDVASLRRERDTWCSLLLGRRHRVANHLFDPEK